MSSSVRTFFLLSIGRTTIVKKHSFLAESVSHGRCRTSTILRTTEFSVFSKRWKAIWYMKFWPEINSQPISSNLGFYNRILRPTKFLSTRPKNVEGNVECKANPAGQRLLSISPTMKVKYAKSVQNYLPLIHDATLWYEQGRKLILWIKTNTHFKDQQQRKQASDSLSDSDSLSCLTSRASGLFTLLLKLSKIGF